MTVCVDPVNKDQPMKTASGGGKMSYIEKGFTLIELMVVIAIVAILVTLSYPSYVQFVRKADRSEAQADLQDWSNRQEVWRADNMGYNTNINPTDTELYAYTMVSTDSTFTLTATALGDQAADKEAGVSCATMTLIQDGSPGPDGHQSCWGH